MGLVQGSRLCQRPISIKSLPQDIIEEQGGEKGPQTSLLRK